MSETDKLAQGMTLKDVRDWHRGCQQAAEADGHDRSAECHKELADAIDAHLAHASAQPAQPASVADGWIDGEPPHPWNKEWFIAVTTDGDRVVLRALPKEYTYDYTTADATYLKAAKIKKWMQFPDSEFVPAPQPPSAMAQDAQDGGVTNEMVLRAVHASLDWPHPLTHFEARKALEAAMAQESGE